MLVHGDHVRYVGGVHYICFDELVFITEPGPRPGTSTDHDIICIYVCCSGLFSDTFIGDLIFKNGSEIRLVIYFQNS